MKLNILSLLLSVTLLAEACGGNYSNEDLDFQNALPAREDLAPHISAFTSLDTAEYYRVTRDGVRGFTSVLDSILGAIDEVRREPATKRDKDVRQWGPWNGDDNPGLQFRVTIRKSLTPVTAENRFGFVFSYAVDVARIQTDVWVNFVRGSFNPAGGVRKGRGQVVLSTLGLRFLGLPLDKDPTDAEDELSWLDTLTIDYATLNDVSWDAVAVLHVDPAAAMPPEATQAQWHYQENVAGNQATYRFAWEGGTDLYVQAAQVASTWRLSDSAGRADVTVTAGLATGKRATECWGPDARGTYINRPFEPDMNRGVESDCVFPAAN